MKNKKPLTREEIEAEGFEVIVDKIGRDNFACISKDGFFSIYRDTSETTAVNLALADVKKELKKEGNAVT